MTNKISRQVSRTFSLLLIVVLLFQLSACSVLKNLPFIDQNSEFQLAEVLFRVEVNHPLSTDSKLMLEILDDVTGVYFNSSRFEMSRDEDLFYSIRLPLKVSTEIKYRYVRVAGSTEYEHDAQDRQVRFRILRVNGPQILEDHIAGWADDKYNGPVGGITGQVIDQSNNAPIPNLLITAAGSQAITSSDGTFYLGSIQPGVHNLVIYSMDGAFSTFQQGALIAEGASTPVMVRLEKRVLTSVKFEVRLPSGLNTEMPLRLVSNLLSLGNAYADLASGSAGSSINYPIMERISKNRYSLSLDLPVGAYIRYKYSFGDGFWNAELSDSGSFVTRDLYVKENVVIKNSVQRFSSPHKAPVTINVKVPEVTPEQEDVFIQLKPFGWMEPIPMIAKGPDVWSYTIFSPLDMVDTVEYRFCRNGICKIDTEGSTEVMTFTPLPSSQELNAVVVDWPGLNQLSVDSSKLLTTETNPTRPGFITGVEVTGQFYPEWRSSLADGLNFARNLGGDYVILSPTWTASTKQDPWLQINPGNDLLWTETMAMVNYVTAIEQKTILFPKINYAQYPKEFWASDQWSEATKLDWLENYRVFLNQYADLAQIMKTDGLIIAEPAITYIPAGRSSIDTEAISRQFNDEQWDSIIRELNSRYSGQLIGVAYFGSDGAYIPAWLSQMDLIYVLLSPSLDIQEDSVPAIRQEFDRILEEVVQPAISELNKPAIIGISYPSSPNSWRGFLLSDPDLAILADGSNSELSGLELQAKIYSAAIQSASQHDWIQGFISRGFFPYLELQDESSSINKKPAADILWFWFHYLLNKAP